jgi:integrase
VFHRRGKPIRNDYGAWRTARTKANVPGRVFYDLRRTAVRNMERAGVPRSVAMKISGHKTEAIYRRYAIVNEQDQRDALQKLDAHRAAQATAAAGDASRPTVVTLPVAAQPAKNRLSRRG